MYVYLGLIVLHVDSFFYAGLWKPWLILAKGSFTNYVYKRRGVKGVNFFSIHEVENVNGVRYVVKKAKILST